MTKIKLHIDSDCYASKPDGLLGIIKPRLQSDDNIVEVEISEIMEKISHGYAISPPVMHNGCSAVNWVEQTLFMIDIDNDKPDIPVMNINEALEVCESNNIKPIFYYFTYRNTDELPKYRLAFLMNKTITDTNIRLKIITALTDLFPQYDPKCRNADRLFFGTNQEVVEYDLNSTITLETIDKIASSINSCTTYRNNIWTTDNIPEGMRNNTLFVKSCKLYERGMNYDEVLAIIENENLNKCEVPLPDKEVITLVKSADKHVNNLPPFIFRKVKGDVVQYNVSSPLLADYIRYNAKYLLVKNNANERTMIYWYKDGVYVNINDDMFKGYIKSYIISYNNTLYKSSIVNEVYNNLITDINFISQEELNNNEDIINFRNGLYNIKSKELIPHTPNIITTIQIPCDWNDSEELNAPIFLSYIDKLTNGDNGKKSLLLQFMGACFSNIKGYRFKKALFLVGDGDTGKSQLKSLTEKILGKENYTSIDLSELEDRFGTSMIYNKRLSGSSDMSFVSVKELKQFKKITGGDSIFTEFKGMQGFDQIYNGLLWFCCNKLPKFSGDNGLWVYNRIIVIRCNNVIPKNQQDKYLLDKMFNERESIVKLAIKELELAIDNSYEFILTDEITRESLLYRQDNNTVACFIKDCCTERTMFNDDCTCQKMYEVYIAYCKDNNNGFAKTKKEFTQELIELSNMTSDTIIKRTNKNTFYVPYTITLETYVSYYRVFGYSPYFESLKNT